MIENELQYNITREQLAKFIISYSDFSSMNTDEDADPRICKAIKDSLLSVITELEKQIEEYEIQHD